MPDEKQIAEEPRRDIEPEGKTAELRDHRSRPEGVVPKQTQSYVIAGLAVLILLAALFSNNRAKQVPKPTPDVPMPTTEANQRKIEELKQDLTDEQRKTEQAQKSSLPTSPSAPVTAPGNSVPPTAVQGASASSAISPAEPPRDPVKDAERLLAFKSRFASNLVSATDPEPYGATLEPTRSDFAAGGSSPAPVPEDVRTKPNLSELGRATPRGDKAEVTTGTEKRPAEVNVNSAVGQPYVLFEGTTLDTALVNRLDGEFSGPIKVMVTNPVYSQDRQHVLIPEGTFLLGDVQKVSGFGQKRLAVVFHRMLMPDGYSVDLDRFHGLNQAGETGLKDRVNNHYVQIFGASIALGVIAGAAEATTNSGYNESGSDMYRQGVASSVAQSGSSVLDRFLSIPPTLTIREGHRVKVYFTEDLLLPAYENHTVPPNI